MKLKIQASIALFWWNNLFCGRGRRRLAIYVCLTFPTQHNKKMKSWKNACNRKSWRHTKAVFLYEQCSPYMLLQVNVQYLSFRLKGRLEMVFRLASEGFQFIIDEPASLSHFHSEFQWFFLLCTLEFGQWGRRVHACVLFSLHKSFLDLSWLRCFLWVLWLKKVLRMTSKILRYPLLGAYFSIIEVKNLSVRIVQFTSHATWSELRTSLATFLQTNVLCYLLKTRRSFHKALFILRSGPIEELCFGYQNQIVFIIIETIKATFGVP